ncbi:MAG: type III-A CRISPR-associated protein Cas10/Csm1 [Desulfobacterales bacterium]|nr:type III-A CRISPR-associated protein Cas10/Csm1 [Desulfobacterales bacterium]
MDETTLKISIAAFIHDIGKFADKDNLNIDDKFINNHAGLYLPSFKGHYTHSHAVYTAAFIEFMKDHLPSKFNQAGWGEGDSFINLASGHHSPQTPMQWIIAMADRISSGLDRESADEYSRQIPIKDYKKTRLLPIFEQLLSKPEEKYNQIDNFSYYYSLEEVSPISIFPHLKDRLKTKEQSEIEYKNLFDNFVSSLKTLKHKDSNISLWFEHFETLIMLYTSSIPSARVGKLIPDVSLYDHLKTTSAFATAIYLYHLNKGTLNINAVQNYDDKKFLIISGKFNGIQSFIFGGTGDSSMYRSKLLRGRSFVVSLFSELSADMICREIGIPFTSVVLNSAGKFNIIAPNTDKSKNAIKTIQENINDWLVRETFGETTIGISYIEASCNDFVSGNFQKLWDKINTEINKSKFSRIDLNRYGGAVDGYLDSFVNSLSHSLCPICGKRPSSIDAEKTRYIEKAESSCGLCRDNIFIGANLVKKGRIAITSALVTNNKENSLLKPIFDKYQLSFTEAGLDNLAKDGTLLKYWDIGLDISSNERVAIKFINGYVPVYKPEDKYDERIDSADEIEAGEIKTLNNIACKAKNFTEKEGDIEGISALGVLKGDIDNLGLIMSSGLNPKRFTISRISTLSRQLNYYFSVYLPHILATERCFNDIYTVFAGGDDFFLIGPWNRISELSVKLKNSFAEYVCRNPEIHFSASITLHKPHSTIDSMSEMAEKGLETSKSGGKNSLTMFSATSKWDEIRELYKIKEILKDWLDRDLINKAMMYRLNLLMEMAEKEKKLVKDKEIHIEDMSCTKWRYMLAYSVGRNAAKNLKGEDRKLSVEQIHVKLADWLKQYGIKLRIPVWDILYNKRK